MSVFHNNSLIGSSGQSTGYSISRSLRFNSSDSAYLSRTPASAGNRKTWSASFWIKRSSIGTEQWVFGNYAGFASGGVLIRLQVNSTLQFASLVGSTFSLNLETTQVFRDSSAWYHFLFVVDTTQSTESERGRFYVNGQRVTAFSTATYPSQNADLELNRTGNVFISGENAGGNFLNAYIADFHFCDGTAYDASAFGEFSATTGVWMPKRFAGTYGTNGFKLDFSDNSAATATTLGKDSSGNGNNWTPNNLSATAGSGNDSLVDVPTNGSEVDTGVGGQVRGNYCTLNPLDKGSSSTLANGNLDYTQTNTAAYSTAKSTFGIGAGKWYWEVTITNRSDTFYSRFGVGILTTADANDNYIGSSSTGYSYFGDANNVANANKVNNNNFTSLGTGGFTTGDTLMFAFDNMNGNLWFGKNGTWLLSGNPATGANPIFSSIPYREYLPGISTFSSNSATSACTANFGQRPFAYTAPSGFKALCTANLPAPVITKPSTVMDVKLYTGNGGTQTISGLGFSPDFTWIKQRSSTEPHVLSDSVRGSTKSLYSNTTGAEETEGPTAYTSDGFSLGSGWYVNRNGSTYAAWTWDAGSSTVTNTQGSISSQVRANASAGFSIVTYTGNGTDPATIGHGLGVAPSLIIAKGRSNAFNWAVYHRSITASNFIYLNSTGAAIGSSAMWNTDPTSTVFSVGNQPQNNSSSVTYVAYCFAPVAGYSSFGSYVGTGAVSTGPFCYTGFRPRLIILKAAVGGTSGWIMVDTARNTYNAVDYFLQANSSGAESTQVILDSLSNGFVIRPVGDAMNNSGVTFVWAAFAESPFQYARAR